MIERNKANELSIRTFQQLKMKDSKHKIVLDNNLLSSQIELDFYERSMMMPQRHAVIYLLISCPLFKSLLSSYGPKLRVKFKLLEQHDLLRQRRESNYWRLHHRYHEHHEHSHDHVDDSGIKDEAIPSGTGYYKTNINLKQSWSTIMNPNNIFTRPRLAVLV